MTIWQFTVRLDPNWRGNTSSFFLHVTEVHWRFQVPPKADEGSNEGITKMSSN